jgi:hypothetical protein
MPAASLVTGISLIIFPEGDSSQASPFPADKNQVSQGRPKIIRKPYYKIEFANRSVIYFRPAGAYGNSFRSLHVDYILVDEGAWLPEKAWKALRQCLRAGGTFRIYSTPNGLRGTYHLLPLNPISQLEGGSLALLV